MAFQVLIRVDRGRAYANLLLDALLKRSPLMEEDRALATELTYGVLRFRGRLDRIIAEASSRPLEQISLEVLNVLRLGAYQLLFLDRVPAYAAVDEAVELAGKVGGKGARAFVNAVLRKVQREGEGVLQRRPGEDKLDYLAAFYSHPRWLLERWLTRLGEEAFAFLKMNNEVPPLSLGTNLLKAKPEGVEEVFKTLATSVERSPWAPGFFRVKNGGHLFQSGAWGEGLFFVMDEAAALVVYLLDPKPGEWILDACSGGGGKTALMAGFMGDEGKVLALDVSGRAIRRFKESCRRLGIRSAEPILGDARRAHELIRTQVDRILVDAPCTGLGTLRRHPEIKWHRKWEDIGRLSRLQLGILEGVASCLKEGGVLVYSTCTPEPEEDEGVVEAFLAAHPEFALEDASPCLPAQELVEGAFLRTYPHRHKTDAFFAARFRKSLR